MPSHRTDGPVQQLNLLLTVMRSPWATPLDVKVMGEVIDRYYPQHGNSRVSVSYLDVATERHRRSSIIASLRRLVSHGMLTVLREGAGTRPTEYLIHFERAVRKTRKLEVEESSTTSGTNGPDSEMLVVANLATPIVANLATTTDPSSGQFSHPNLLTLPAYYRPGESESANARTSAGALADAAPGKEDSGSKLPAMAGHDGTFRALEAIWAECPHVDDLSESQRLYAAAITETEPGIILAAAKACIVSADEPRFIPRLSKWLRGRGWEKPPRKRPKQQTNGGGPQRKGRVDLARAMLDTE
jgi:hypothetical protein